MEDQVILVGNVDNPYPIIKDASLLVLSSDFEGLSMAILEALKQAGALKADLIVI